MDGMTVGELARRSGLTVRTLHHYDQIGLLRPALRSAAGYRLYGRDDVARLHAIQALRQLGLALKDIAALLAGGEAALPTVLAQQRRALDAEIARASALRDRLTLLLERYADGGAPALADWLAALDRMAAYGRHFSADEVRQFLARWQAVRAEWPPLVAAVRAAMAAGQPPEDPALQPLAHRWMGLVHHLLGGDFEQIGRWGRMLQAEPATRAGDGLDRALLDYIAQATAPRLAAWCRHFTLDELARLRWEGGRQTAGGDAELARRLAAAWDAEPLLRLGMPRPDDAAVPPAGPGTGRRRGRGRRPAEGA